MTCSSASTLTPISSVPVMPPLAGVPSSVSQALKLWAQQVLAQIQAAGGATGVNAIPQQYALVAGSALPPIASVSNCTVALDTTQQLFGAGSYKVSLTGSPAVLTLASDTAWPLQPGWQWMVSFFQQASAAVASEVTVTTSAGTAYSATFTTTLDSAGWDRLYDALNLVADTSAAFGLSFTFTGGAGQTVWLDGLMLSPFYGRPSLLPSFQNGSAPLLLDNNPDGFYSKILSSRTAGNVAFNFRGAWSSTANYLTGDEVVYGPTYWVALTDSTNVQPATGVSAWQAVGSYSEFVGAWSSAATYAVGAEVTYSGNFWVALVQNSNSPPSTSNTDWQIAGPVTLDNVADGTTYQRPLATALTSGQVDLSKAGVISKTLTNVTDGTARFAVVNASGMNGASYVDANNNPRIDFSGSYHLNKNLTNVPDGASRFAVTNAAGMAGVSYVDANNNPRVDFTQSYHIGKVLDNIPDGTTRFAVKNGSMYGVSYIDPNSRALIDFTQGGHLWKNTDNIPPGTGTGATTLAVIGAQRNLIPDSSLKSVSAYWAAGNNYTDIIVSTNLDGFTNCFEYIGNGSPAGYNWRQSLTIPVNPGGVYTLSAVVGGGNVTAGGATLGVWNTAETANYGYITIDATTNGRVSAPVNIPAGVTQAKILFDLNNCTVSNGNGLFCQQMQLEAGSVMTAYQETMADQLSGTTLIDFTSNAHVGKILDNVPDGTSRFAVKNGSMYGVSYIDPNSRALIDFSQSGHLNKTLDNIASTSSNVAFDPSYLDSSRRVSTPAGAVSPLGSIATGASTVTFSYSSTDAAVTISWTAGTLYRMDGTQTSVAAGSVTVSSLTASTTYYAAAYYDETTAAVDFVTGETGATGSPAILYTSESAVVSWQANLQGCIDFGWLQVATAASGGTGGGGTGGACCVAGRQRVRMGDGSWKFAEDIEAGDTLPCPGGVTTVRAPGVVPWRDWRRVAFENGVELIVAEGHRFVDPAGAQRYAVDLRVNDVIQTDSGYTRVVAIVLDEHLAQRVSVEVNAPHLYYLNGILCHNKYVCK